MYILCVHKVYICMHIIHARASWVSAVCKGTLTCWKVHLLHRFSFLADEIKFSSNLSHHITPFIFLLMMSNAPALIAEKQSYFMILPPLYATVVIEFLGSYAQVLQDDRLNYFKRFLHFIFSNQSILFEMSSDSSKCFQMHISVLLFRGVFFLEL